MPWIGTGPGLKQSFLLLDLYKFRPNNGNHFFHLQFDGLRSKKSTLVNNIYATK